MEYERTKLTFLATMYAPDKKGQVKATCVVPIERFKEKCREVFLECEAAGKDVVLLKIIGSEGKGKGDFWLAAESPPDRNQKPDPEKPSSDW